MKKFLLLFTLLFSSLIMNAEGHLKFMGVEINGKANIFVEKMKAKGFRVKDNLENAFVMNGKFAGSNAQLFILYSPITKTVCKVVAYFEEKDNWDSLKSQYLKLKEAYDTKYPIVSAFDFFCYPYNEGEGDEMTAVKLDKCRYSTFYELQEGMIVIKISEFAQVSVAYEDSKNINLLVSEQNKKIMNDI